MSDPEIIARTLRGDRAAFRLLVERHHRRIYGLAHGMTRDHHLSEDLVQDVFLEAYRQLPRFDPARAQFSTWLYRIAHNKTLNALTKKRPLFLAEPPDAPAAGGVHDEIDARELWAAMDRALQTLPPAQRIAFVWADLEQLSYQEIADIEHTTVSAVKSRINRARQAIQAAVRPYTHSPHD